MSDKNIIIMFEQYIKNKDYANAKSMIHYYKEQSMLALTINNKELYNKLNNLTIELTKRFPNRIM